MDGISVRVDMREVAAFAARFPHIQTALLAGTTRAMTRVVLEGERRAKQNVAVDTGHYRRSLTHDVQTTPRSVIGRIGSNVPYAPVREFGRRPGKRMPPRGSLLSWMRRHGIPPELEFILRRRIARHGIEGEHVFQDVLRDIRPLLEKEVANLKPKLIAALRGTAPPGAA